MRMRETALLAARLAPTAGANLLALLCGAVSGLLIARFLGPDGRGDYTAVTAWFGLLLMIAELGQTSAVVYFVARERERGEDWLRTSRWIMVIIGVPVTVAAIAAAPLLSSREDLVLGYRAMFILIAIAMLSGSSMATLQAKRLNYWNIGRLISPVSTLAMTGILAATDELTLRRALLAYGMSLLLQAATIGSLSLRVIPRGGRFRADMARELIKYGSAQLASRTPTVVNGYADKILLSQMATAPELGRYAVAVAFTVLIVPIASAIGAFSMPRIASHAMSPQERASLVRTALRICLVSSVAIMVPVVTLAHVYVPLLLGDAFDSSIRMIWVLGPGSVFLALSQVQGDILRGLGRPLSIARAQGAASLVTVLMLAVLIPLWGAMGAALTSTVAYLLASLLLARSVRAEVP